MNAFRFASFSSIIAILLSVLGLVYVGYSFFYRDPEERLFRYVWGSIGWCLLLWGSIIGFQTCRKYNLEEEDARFFSYIFCGVLGVFVGYVLGMTTAIVIPFLLFMQILNRKKKIIQKYHDLQEGN